MRTPRSLRIARLLLVGAAAASIGCVAIILPRASGVSPFLAFFVAAAALFVAAARTLERDVSGGRLLAAAGAFTLAGVGVLSGFGAGDVTFPAAGLGVLAAWAATLHPPRRSAVYAFAAFVIAGVVATAPRFFTALAYPWTLATLFLWPWTLLLVAPPLGFVPIYGSFGIALALVAAYASRRAQTRPSRLPPLSARAVAGYALAGAAAVALYVALAYARESTSARFELEPIALAALFVAGSLAALGAAALRSSPAIGVVATALAGAVLLFSFVSRPTVECGHGGAATGPGPWWMAWRGGSLSSEGRVGPDGSASGTIRRGDGAVMTYRCADARLVEFSIAR